MTGQIGHVSFTLQERLVSPVPSHGSTKTVRRTAHPMFAWVREELNQGQRLCWRLLSGRCEAQSSKPKSNTHRLGQHCYGRLDTWLHFGPGSTRWSLALVIPRTNCAVHRPAKGPLLSSTRTDTPCMNHTVSTQVCFAPERAIHGSKKPQPRPTLVPVRVRDMVPDCPVLARGQRRNV